MGAVKTNRREKTIGITVAYRDDSQIVDATVRKWYSDTPRVEVEITELTPEVFSEWVRAYFGI